LVSRHKDFHKTVDVLIPFLVTRQIFLGAGKLMQTPRGTTFSMAQRAEHIWEGVSSATTRSRPIINTRDEPHADAERYRRLHVIAGDSNMSEYATYVKVGTVVALLQMIERDVVFRDLTLENPIRAIREIAHDITCRRKVRLAHGRELSALDIQWEYFERVSKFSRNPGFPPEVQAAVDRWEHLLTGLEKDPMSLDREVDWVIKYRLLERYREQRGLPLSHPRLAMLDLSYHDVDRARGVYNLLARQDMVDRVLTDGEISRAAVQAPQTTRARLRGEFIKAAKAKRRDFTVDWVHLKLNDQAQRTVLCKDPFKSHDERVDRLIESL
ncbi:MAG TPA: proteasome accessory factor PafA2 family protein, partial [Acidimicrobiia bacterium]|nr:proteasome accessory factor PafA2 family protein [Acidimicrobiia bacterium]